MDMPPTRIRVVEQGRRLVVIDTARDAAALPTRRDLLAKAVPTRPVRTKFDGSATLTTHPLYDARGPRTVTLDPGAAAWIGRAPALLIALVILLIVVTMLQPLVLLGLVVPAIHFAKPARRRITRWLDARSSGTM